MHQPVGIGSADTDTIDMNVGGTSVDSPSVDEVPKKQESPPVPARVSGTLSTVRTTAVVLLSFTIGFVIRPYLEQGYHLTRAHFQKNEYSEHGVYMDISTEKHAKHAADVAVDNLVKNYDGNLLGKTVFHCCAHGDCVHKMSDFLGREEHKKALPPLQDLLQILTTYPELFPYVQKKLKEEIEGLPSDDPRRSLLLPQLSGLAKKDRQEYIVQWAQQFLDAQTARDSLLPELKSGRKMPPPKPKAEMIANSLDSKSK